MLKTQLKAVGAAPVSAVPLQIAERRMRDAVRRMMNGDPTAENEIERWDQSIRMNPEYIKREQAKTRKWEEGNKDKNRVALRHMRYLIPPNVNHATHEELVAGGLPPEAAKRILERKALWLVRFTPEHVQKLHVAELLSKYSQQGLDIMEMRAVYCILPKEFDNDSDGKKTEWVSMFRTKLKSLCERDEAGTLPSNERRHRAYREADRLKLFDPDKGYIHLNFAKSTAFAPTEKPVVSRARPSTSSRRSTSLSPAVEVKEEPRAPIAPSGTPRPPRRLDSSTQAENPMGGLLAELQKKQKSKRRSSAVL